MLPSFLAPRVRALDRNPRSHSSELVGSWLLSTCVGSVMKQRLKPVGTECFLWGWFGFSLEKLKILERAPGIANHPWARHSAILRCLSCTLDPLWGMLLEPLLLRGLKSNMWLRAGLSQGFIQPGLGSLPRREPWGCCPTAWQLPQ